MKLFKNGVGRPSNETIRNRRIVIGSIVIVSVLLVAVAGVYLFKRTDIIGNSKHATYSGDFDSGSGYFSGVTISSITSSSAKISTKKYYRAGDVYNSSGKKQGSDNLLNSDDARMILKFSSNQVKPANSIIRNLADINQDGKITATDARIVFRMANEVNDPDKKKWVEPMGIYGDVNFDKVIDVKDKAIYYDHLYQNKSMSSTALKVADVDENGKVEKKDYKMLSSYENYDICVVTTKSSGGCQWKSSGSTFSSLKANTKYYVYARKKTYNHATTYLVNEFTTLKAVQAPSKAKTFTITFDKNGADSIGSSKLSCTVTSSGTCTITMPKIERKGKGAISSVVYGWNTDKNAKSAKYDVDQKVTVSKDMVLYAISSVEVEAAFVPINGKKEYQYCEFYNTNSSCNVSVPSAYVNTAEGWGLVKYSTSNSYKKGTKAISVSSDKTFYELKTIKIRYMKYGKLDKEITCSGAGGCQTVVRPYTDPGKYAHYWCNSAPCKKDGYFEVGKKAIFTKDTTLYATTSFDPNGKMANGLNITIGKSFRIGSAGTLFEIEKGYGKNVKELDTLSKVENVVTKVYNEGMEFLFVPGKFMLLKDATYDKTVLMKNTAGVTYSSAYSLLLAKERNYVYFKDVIVHELAHAWDYYFGNKSSDNKSYVNEGFKEGISSTKRNEINKAFKSIIEKYIASTNKGYK